LNRFVCNNYLSFMSKISTANAEHYTWGDNCDGWHLLKSDSLNVISERMPPGTSEKLHYHKNAQQLFYILKGNATIELDDKVFHLMVNECIHIPKGSKHCIRNISAEELVFLLISEPRAQTDRIDLC
jgi:mannose-6-phosphate isomerase-like protein (cupin superfamily)